MAMGGGKNTLKKIAILSFILPVIGFFVLDLGLPYQRWMSIPVHAILETIGLTVGLITALFLLSTNPGKQEIRSIFDWIAAALIAMAVLDGFHAAVLPGNTAVWLHSMAGLSPGVLFSPAYGGGDTWERKRPVITLPGLLPCLRSFWER